MWSVSMRKTVIMAVALAAASCATDGAAAPVREPPLATEAEMQEALAALDAWTTAFRAEDYAAQRDLTDPRIRRWQDLRRWRDKMTEARADDGRLETIEVEAMSPITGAQLPCTEQHHCWRRGVKYVFFSLHTTYERAAPPQPEYAVVAWSEEGWRFAGGTFPNRPMDETMVILTELDEKRYEERPF